MNKHSLGEKALKEYADKEHVEVCKRLIGNIIEQILVNAEADDISEYECHEIVVSGLIKLFRDEAEFHGYHNLSYELKSIE